MNNQGIGSWIYRRARMTPWKTAIIDKDTRWNYSELSNKINRLAHGFRSLGIGKGDRIAYLNVNHSSYIETLFASGLLGAIFVPLNKNMLPEDMGYVLNETNCKLLIYGSILNDMVERLKPIVRIPRYLSLDQDDKNEFTLKTLIAIQPDSLIDEVVLPEETALISFTSGTTGKPKGVVLSHANLSWNVFNLLSAADFLSDDIILVQAPLHRMGSLGVTVLPGIFKGAALIISAESEIKTIAQIIKNRKVSVLFGGPDFFQMLEDYVNENEADLSSIRFCIVGGDVVPPALVRRWLDRGIQFQQGYGLTEAAPVALLLDKEEMLSKNGSAGRPVFFLDIRVVSQDMKDTGPGENGEIILKGPNIIKGYWNDPILTNEKITRDNWLHSGDAARMDKDNHTYILGRLTDEIILKGRTIYPSEIEEILLEHPDVMECAVIGLPGEKNDQIAVFIVPKENKIRSEPDLLKLISRTLPENAITRSIQYVESLPKNANGKILRQKLRELCVKAELT